MTRAARLVLIHVCLLLTWRVCAEDAFDIVIANGRVIDPETQLDAVRNVGIRAGSIAAVSEQALAGKETIDASKLVVAPGFIELHWHGRDPASDVYQAMDGVTTWFELEVGTDDVDTWYAKRAGTSLLNHGVAIGHMPVRMALYGDSGDFLPADKAIESRGDDAKLAQIKQRIDRGLRQGAVAVGMGLAYTPGAPAWEPLEVFRVAAQYQAPVFVHIRGASSAAGANADREAGLLEVIAHSAVSGAPLHVAHIQSSGQASTARMLGIIAQARSHGVDVTTECYPYTAGATRIESYLFSTWSDKPESEYQKLQWSATGERLTKESFQRYRKQGGLVLIHANTPEVVDAAVAHPATIIASDGFDVYPGNGHPRSAGTFARVLGHHVRERGLLSLPDAIKKMTLMPAQRLEGRVASMKKKGRIQVGADADISVFDPATIIDTASYEKPASYAQGLRYVLVNGTFVVRGATPVGAVTPGKPVRAP